MGMVVRTNIMGINANRQLGMNNSQVSKSLEKLSSGYRINRAGDDASGLAISEKMKAQIKGLEQAPQNLLPRIMEVACGMRDELKVFGTDYDTRDGTCIRDYVHVTDLAIAHVKALDYIAKNDKSITVNLGTEKGTTVKELIEASRRITKKAIPAVDTERRPGDPACLYATSAFAKKELDWEPKYSDVDLSLIHI